MFEINIYFGNSAVSKSSQEFREKSVFVYIIWVAFESLIQFSSKAGAFTKTFSLDKIGR